MEKMVVVLMTLLLASDAIGEVTGTWNRVDEKSGKLVSEVRLYQQGTRIFGKITALSEPTDPQGRPKICTKCPGPDKDKPIVGLVIIRDLSLDGDRYKGGTIMDPQDGTIYKAEIWPEDGKLKVRGYRGVFHKTQTWMRAP